MSRAATGAERGAEAHATLDTFLSSYYRLRPVNATFTGNHDHDRLLPYWAPDGLTSATAEMQALQRRITAARRALPHATSPTDLLPIDLALASGFLAIQIAEHEGDHFHRKNPSMHLGEAVFGIVSLLLARAPDADALLARLTAIPRFLADARNTLEPTSIPASWLDRARDECEGARQILGPGLRCWVDEHGVTGTLAVVLLRAAQGAIAAVTEFAAWLTGRPTTERVGCGSNLLSLLLTDGHWCRRTAADLLADVADRFAAATAALARDAASIDPGGWPAVQDSLTRRHPAPAGYLDAFGTMWDRCREHAVRHDLVTWPRFPLRYVRPPEWARSALPHLYFLHYRSPAPLDLPATVEYLVPDLGGPSDDRAIGHRLEAVNDSVIKLNHVVHHGALGHHVQNYHAYRAASRIGRVAAVDCASRIGMFCGGTLAEGWACYATDLMDETGFLTDRESLAEQHSRIRQLGRTIVDIRLHTGEYSEADATAFYVASVGMSEQAARKDVTRTSMFPGTGLMYWLGTQAIHDLRAARRAAEGASFSLRRFHDDFLSYGAIPALAIADLMTPPAAA